MTETRPSIARVATAFVAAPVAATGAFAAASLVIAVMGGAPIDSALGVAVLVGFYGFFIAAAATLVFGLPAYLLLRSWVRNRLSGAAATGAAIAALATATLLLAANGGFTVGVEGWPWLLVLTSFAGALAGVVFWWVAVGPWVRSDAGSR